MIYRTFFRELIVRNAANPGESRQRTEQTERENNRRTKKKSNTENIFSQVTYSIQKEWGKEKRFFSRFSIDSMSINSFSSPPVCS